MDFFSIQDSRQKQSAFLILVFIACMIAMGVIVHVVSVAISVPFSNSVSFTESSFASKVFIGLIWFICCVGCYFRILDVQAGGVVLAQRYGGVEARSNSRDRREKELLSIVEEMAIASRSHAPPVFVMPQENAINAFVVGGFKGKEALVVTKGALEKLDREELSAVVAHEFAHIVQGDLPLNMRLHIALGGLTAIDDVGKLLIGKQEDRISAHPGILVGYVVRALGSVGIFFGQTVRSAVSRQREFLADARAVQFTRMPEYLTSALMKIQDERDDAGIHGKHAQELAHLCFYMNDISYWHKKMFATHPELQSRIKAIDPHAAAKHNVRKRQRAEDKPSTPNIGNGVAGANVGGASVGAANVGGVDSFLGGIEFSGLTDHASVLLNDSVTCVAVLHALFVSSDKEKSKQYYHAISFAYNNSFAAKVKELKNTLSHDIKNNRKELIDIAAENIRTSVKIENRQRLLQSLEKLLRVEDEYTLMNYATLQLIRNKLDIDFPVLKKVATEQSESENVVSATGSLTKSFDSMGAEFSVLLSLIIEASGNADETREVQFKAALQCYTKEEHPMRFANEPGIVQALEDAFQTLYVQPLTLRQAFVEHCIEIAEADHYVAGDERAMLDLFATALKCELLGEIRKAA